MCELRGDVDLAHEPLGTERGDEAGLQDLERHKAVMFEVLGEVHVGHTTATDQSRDVVAISQRGTKTLNVLSRR